MISPGRPIGETLSRMYAGESPWWMQPSYMWPSRGGGPRRSGDGEYRVPSSEWSEKSLYGKDIPSPRKAQVGDVVVHHVLHQYETIPDIACDTYHYEALCVVLDAPRDMGLDANWKLRNLVSGKVYTAPYYRAPRLFFVAERAAQGPPLAAEQEKP